MISVLCPFCQTEYDLPDDYVMAKVACRKCNGRFVILDTAGRTQAVSANQDNHRPQSQPQLNKDWNDLKNSAEQKVRETFGFEKVENFKFSSFMSQVFKRHSWEEVEDYVSTGTPNKTPDISELRTTWPMPWLFFCVMIVTVAAVLFMYWKGDFFGIHNIVMPLLLFGVIGLPLATLIFFWELNIPKNISMLLLIRIMIISGFLSIAITFLLHRVFPEFVNPCWAGPIEETAKALTMLFFLKNNKYCYKLNGLLIGAAVGAGFAVMETGGYVIGYGDEGNFVMILRALISPFGHIPWSAMVGFALWRVAENGRISVERLLQRKFIALFLCAVGLHILWNSDILPIILTAVIVGLTEYTIIVYLLQEGINEIREMKRQTLSS